MQEVDIEAKLAIEPQSRT
jgi:hypothetical protein